MSTLDAEYVVANESTQSRRALAVLDRIARLLRRYPLGAFGMLTITVIAVAALAAPLLAPYGANETFVGDSLEGPSWAHWFGTDNLGRDMFSRVLYGGRVSIMIGLLATSISVTLATTIGLISGYMGGRVDFAVQRFVDLWMSMPGLVLLITLAAVLPSTLVGSSIAIGAILAGNGVRIIRSTCLSVMTMPYVEAARSLGASDTRIILSYVLRNVAAFVIIVGSVQIGAAILLEANISFLGFGIAPPTPAWGSMLGGQGRLFMLQAPWLSIWPGVAIALVVFSANVFGDAIRDALDPYAVRRRG